MKQFIFIIFIGLFSINIQAQTENPVERTITNESTIKTQNAPETLPKDKKEREKVIQITFDKELFLQRFCKTKKKVRDWWHKDCEHIRIEREEEEEEEEED